LRPRIIAWAILSPVVTGFYAAILLSEPPLLRADIVLVLISIIPELQVVRYWRMRVRDVKFYSSTIMFNGRGTSFSCAYSDVARVMTAKNKLGSKSVLISFKGKEVPAKLLSIPSNKELGMDLVTWLESKSIPVEEIV
jgi:hypothetical protein